MPASGKPQSGVSHGDAVHIEPWDEGDLVLLHQLMGDPAMMEHLGGPESDEQIIARHARYVRLADSDTDRMFKIVHDATGAAVGSVGYWERIWRGEPVYEMGWSVLVAFQGRGIAGAATAQAIERARSDGRHHAVHAFPSVDNPPSNAVCRKLGFALVGACDFEYPPGHFMRCNDWRLALSVND